MSIVAYLYTTLKAFLAGPDGSAGAIAVDPSGSQFTRDKPLIAGQRLAAFAVPLVAAKSVTDVGSGPVPLACREVHVKAPNSNGTGGTANTKTVWVGLADVTVGAGWPLEPGESITLLTQDAAAVYAIAGDANQTLRIFVVTS